MAAPSVNSRLLSRHPPLLFLPLDISMVVVAHVPILELPRNSHYLSPAGPGRVCANRRRNALNERAALLEASLPSPALQARPRRRCGKGHSMALPAPPANQPMPAAGPSGARAAHVPVPPGPSPRRVRFGLPAAIEIDSDPEDDYDMDDLLFLPARQNVRFKHKVDDDGDDDVQIAGFAPVAGPAPKEPQQANRAGAQAGPVPAAAATSPFEDAVQAIVGILPDISRAHLKTQLLHQPAYGPAEIEAVLEGFLSMPNGYPKEADDVVAKGAAAGGSGGGGKGKGRADEHEQARNGEAFMQVENTIDEDDEIERTAQSWVDIPKRGANWHVTYHDAA